jgi:hypothetical protein
MVYLDEQRIGSICWRYTRATPKEPTELMEFYMFDDDWDSGVVPNAQVEQEVLAKAGELLIRLGLSDWEPAPVILDAVLTGP